MLGVRPAPEGRAPARWLVIILLVIVTVFGVVLQRRRSATPPKPGAPAGQRHLDVPPPGSHTHSGGWGSP